MLLTTDSLSLDDDEKLPARLPATRRQLMNQIVDAHLLCRHLGVPDDVVPPLPGLVVLNRLPTEELDNYSSVIRESIYKWGVEQGLIVDGVLQQNPATVREPE